jgi:hypothetical protein
MEGSIVFGRTTTTIRKDDSFVAGPSFLSICCVLCDQNLTHEGTFVPWKVPSRLDVLPPTIGKDDSLLFGFDIL